MKKTFLIALIIIVSTSYSWGKEDLTRQEPIEVVVKMTEFKFIPNHLEFEAGKLYKLKLVNIGKTKHEFDSPRLSDKVFTQKIVVVDKKGNMIAEIKGNPYEIEIAPEQTVEWWFMPITSEKETGEIICDIPGHLEAGMRGTVVIISNP
jgi:uncharacterized cupredoxin-like copper-binding protein